MSLIDSFRAEARAAPESGIVAVVNYGRLREYCGHSKLVMEVPRLSRRPFLRGL